MLRIITLLLLLALSVSVNAQASPLLTIVQRPLLISEHRLLLMKEYSLVHYGREMTAIIPQAVVIHWTAFASLEETYSFFYAEETADAEMRSVGRLNVAAHFLVGRDGTIYQLTPETFLNRHIIGLNWCAIGIENVGGVDGTEDLTAAQLAANSALIHYLCQKYPTITYVFGHYQQAYAKQAGLWHEEVDNYYAEKDDPGPAFMTALYKLLSDLPLKTFPL